MNTLAEKNNTGRPKKFAAPKELEDAFLKYLDHCQKIDDFPNISGFASYMNISRDTYYATAQRDGFSDTVNKVNTLLESITIQKGLEGRNPAFIIFYLKNKFGWADKTEVNVNKRSINIDIDASSAQGEAAQKAIDAILRETKQLNSGKV